LDLSRTPRYRDCGFRDNGRRDCAPSTALRRGRPLDSGSPPLNPIRRRGVSGGANKRRIV
jgi:hypothetical protein